MNLNGALCNLKCPCHLLARHAVHDHLKNVALAVSQDSGLLTIVESLRHRVFASADTRPLAVGFLAPNESLSGPFPVIPRPKQVSAAVMVANHKNALFTANQSSDVDNSAGKGEQCWKSEWRSQKMRFLAGFLGRNGEAVARCFYEICGIPWPAAELEDEHCATQLTVG